MAFLLHDRPDPAMRQGLILSATEAARRAPALRWPPPPFMLSGKGSK